MQPLTGLSVKGQIVPQRASLPGLMSRLACREPVANTAGAQPVYNSAMPTAPTPDSTVSRSAAPRFPMPSVGPNRTGGVVWHARALQASARWQPTRDAIGRWLACISFDSRQLILVGASAGWMMSTDFLARFDAIEAIDIDPLAAPLFAWRHGLRLKRRGVQVRWHRMDALAELDELVDRWPEAGWLFDNVLGQQIYRHHDLDAVEAALAGLAQRLAGREWASVHDWLSGPARPPAPQAVLDLPPERAVVEPGGLVLKGQSQRFEIAGESLLATLNAHGQWQDHRTAGVFPAGTEVALIPWEFRSGKWHWLQAGHVFQCGQTARTRFEARAARGNPAKALKILDELDRSERAARS